MHQKDPASGRGRRSVLCVPGADPAIVDKALASTADEVVIDLEDAVAPERKNVAREVVRRLGVREGGPRVLVRVNPLRSPWGLRDLRAVAESAGNVEAVVIPKVESREDLAAVEHVLDGLAAELARPVLVRVHALIETAAGVMRLADIVSRRDRLEAVVIGYADLAASLGRSPEAEPWTWGSIQLDVLVRARAAGVAAIDGPHLSVADDDTFASAVANAADLGFDAKWVIHPRQIDRVNTAFTPAPAAVDRAERIVAALSRAHAEGAGALQLDGELIDEAMAVAARRILERGRR